MQLIELKKMVQASKLQEKMQASGQTFKLKAQERDACSMQEIQDSAKDGRSPLLSWPRERFSLSAREVAKLDRLDVD